VKTSPVNIAPLQYNYDSKVFAPYFEDTQRLFSDRLVLKAGARFDTRTQALRHTPYESSTIDTRSRSFDAVTFRLGSTYKLADSLSLKASVGSGFRAPNPNELSGDSFSGNGVKSVGNPNLKNESSLGWEVGAVSTHDAFSGEISYFDSNIKDRITAYVNAAATAANGYTTTIASNINHAVTRGLELRLAYDLGRHLGSGDYKIEPFVSGTYHFLFEVRDPVYNALNNDRHIQRVNRYQGTVGLRTARKQLWDFDLNAVFSGPTYESGGTLGLADANYPINPATGARNTAWIFKKDSYWLLNSRVGYQLSERLRLFGGANNLLDRNYDPSFLALNEVNYKYTVNPYKSQSRGTTGGSSPGRELFAGIQYSF
jgi:vitamin B12 transporter